jgi:uncharacterized SAM-dependent methyltransferase
MENHYILYLKLDMEDKEVHLKPDMDMEVNLRLDMEVMQGHTMLVEVMQRHTIMVCKRKMVTKMIEFLICLLICTTQNRKVLERTLYLLS